MSLLNELIGALVDCCRAEVSSVGKKVCRSCASMVFFFMATIFGLWTMGLLIAALVVGLCPHLGAAWAVMLGAGAAFLACLVAMLIGMCLKK